ncbi:MAG: TlpA disulfide reductase family protein [Minisyncoccia bacterium]
MSFSRLYLGIGIMLTLLLAGGIGYYVFFVQPTEGAVSFENQYDLVLKEYDGTEVELSEFKRTLLLVHVWASWCPYCKEELQNLARLKEIHGDDISIIAVNRAESLAEAKTFTDLLQLPDSISLLLDPEDAFYKDIGGYAMPETIFINEKGEIIFHQRGPMKFSEVTERIKLMLE